MTEDIGSIRICGVGTFYGIDAANTTTTVTVTVAVQSGTANGRSLRL